MLRALFLLFVVLPLADLAVMYRLGMHFGFLSVLAVALVVGAIGTAVAKREGLRVFERWNRALAEGRAPEEGVVSSALLLLAGVLLVLPGFLSDLLGLLLLLPPVRSLVARLLRARFEADVAEGRVEVMSFGGPFGPSGPAAGGRGRPRNGDVIDVVGEDVSPPGPSGTNRPRLPGDGPDRTP